MEDVQPGRARFDADLQAWILSSHGDVTAALREPRLVAVDGPDPAAHLGTRDAMARTLSADRLAAWRPAFERSALDRAASLPTDRPLDLLTSYAVPWALSLAVTVTGVSPAAAPDLARLAREVFVAFASGSHAGAAPGALEPAAELARRLPAAEATTNVQTFVALSQTLPHLLGGAWLELFSRPDPAMRLRQNRHLPARALEELLRLGGPSHAVVRRARADVHIGAANILSGERVVLMLAAANRDPVRFTEPHRLDIHRGSRDHLAFGAGTYACSGARLVRMAAGAATAALLRTTDAIEVIGPVTWIHAFAIRAPTALPAVLRATPPRPETTD